MLGISALFRNLCHRSVRFLILLGLLIEVEDLHQFLKDISAVGDCRLMYTPVLNCNRCKLILTNPLLCALVYRPPKLHKDFISEFTGFLGGIMTKYDRLLIFGDLIFMFAVLQTLWLKNS